MRGAAAETTLGVWPAGCVLGVATLSSVGKSSSTFAYGETSLSSLAVYGMIPPGSIRGNAAGDWLQGAPSASGRPEPARADRLVEWFRESVCAWPGGMPVMPAEPSDGFGPARFSAARLDDRR